MPTHATPHRTPLFVDETAKLNGLNPQHYLAGVLARTPVVPLGHSPIGFLGTNSPPLSIAPPLELGPSPSTYFSKACYG
jgi:hypothetical protein